MDIQNTETDGNDRPIYPLKLIETKIIINPFNDITVRNRTSN